MPDLACEPLRLADSQFQRPVIPQEPFADPPSVFRSKFPHMVAGGLTRAGIAVIPVHGVIKTATGYECDCQPGARWRAKKDGLDALACTMPGKMPRLKDWPNQATTDLQQIVKWVSPRERGKPTSNFAAVTGPKSAIWVLDIDGEQGFDSLRELLAAIGVLPKTWTTNSGSGKGAHYWWRLPAGVVVRNSANKLAPKIDVRGLHGQIIVPGSMHYSGNRYMWAEGCAPDETDLVEAPEALLNLALEACKKTQRQQPQSRVTPKRAQRVVHSQPQGRRGGKGVFGVIGDGPGRHGFHAGINMVACSFFAQFREAADLDLLKATLIDAISNAPTIDREPNYAARYLDPARLDAAIESARAFILEN